MKTGDVLTNDNVFQNRTGTPPHLNLYAFDVCNIGAIAHGIKDALDGAKVVFVAATRIDNLAPVAVKFVAIHQEPFEDSKVLKWSDSGSLVHSYILDCNPKEIHLALLTGTIVKNLLTVPGPLPEGANLWLFRLPNLS